MTTHAQQFTSGNCEPEGQHRRGRQHVRLLLPALLLLLTPAFWLHLLPALGTRQLATLPGVGRLAPSAPSSSPAARFLNRSGRSRVRFHCFSSLNKNCSGKREKEGRGWVESRIRKQRKRKDRMTGKRNRNMKKMREKREEGKRKK